jgi:hypothetical protein
LEVIVKLRPSMRARVSALATAALAVVLIGFAPTSAQAYAYCGGSSNCSDYSFNFQGGKASFDVDILNGTQATWQAKLFLNGVLKCTAEVSSSDPARSFTCFNLGAGDLHLYVSSLGGGGYGDISIGIRPYQ